MSEIVEGGYWEGRRVCILGGFGFLGQHLTYALEARGASVVRLSRRVGLHLEMRGSAMWYLSAAHDTVINVAARQGGIAFQTVNPLVMLDENTMICANACAGAVSFSHHYINVISSCAYPSSPKPMREEDLFDGPVHGSAAWYATAKRLSTSYALAARELGHDSRTVVLPNLYGPGDHYSPDRSHAMAALIRKFYEGKANDAERVTVWGTGTPVREWMYAADAAEGILAYAELSPEVSPPILNIGHGVGLTIGEIANLVQKISGFKGNMVYDTEKPDGPAAKVMNVALMRKTLSWRPRVMLNEGIGKAYDWLVENYQRMLQANIL